MIYNIKIFTIYYIKIRNILVSKENKKISFLKKIFYKIIVFLKETFTFAQF